MDNTKIDAFKAELKELLTKYNATISCNVDGDTHGLSYEMSVDFGGADKWKDYKLSDSAGIDKDDL
jgi:hypothetical protein